MKKENHILGHKINLNKLKIIFIIQNLFYSHNGANQKFGKREITRKSLNNIHLNNQRKSQEKLKNTLN